MSLCWTRALPRMIASGAAGYVLLLLSEMLFPVRRETPKLKRRVVPVFSGHPAGNDGMSLRVFPSGMFEKSYPFRAAYVERPRRHAIVCSGGSPRHMVDRIAAAVWLVGDDRWLAGLNVFGRRVTAARGLEMRVAT